MALVFADGIKETTSTNGTGTLNLAGAVTGFRSFADVGDGNTCFYFIEAIDGGGARSGEWETGIGTYTLAGTLLARTTVISNSLGTQALINFGAGTKNVAIGPVAVNMREVRCKVQLAANFQIATATNAIIDYVGSDHEIIDTDGFHDGGGADPEKLIVPTGLGGLYLGIGHIIWEANASAARRCGVQAFDSGDTAIDFGTSALLPTAVIDAPQQQAVLIVRLADGGYINHGALQRSGGNLDARGGAITSGFTSLSLQRIAP